MLKILSILLLLCGSWAQAADLAWNASVVDEQHAAPDGYRIHWGSEPGVYTGQVDVGNQLFYHIPDDYYGTFYFVASAYNEAGQSGYSNEVLFTRDQPQQHIGATGLRASRYQIEEQMAKFSDDFNRTDSTNLGSNWSEDAGDAAIATNRLLLSTSGWDPIVIKHNTALATADQYILVTFPVKNETYPHIIFRYTNSSSPFYAIIFYLQNLEPKWARSASAAMMLDAVEIGSASSLGSWNAGDSVGITVSGTGDDTVINFWLRPTGTAPSAANLWGGAAPSASITVNPGANAVNSGSYIGLGGVQGSAGDIVFDNFFGGDISASAVKGGRGNLGIMRGMSRLMWLENDFLKPIGGQ